MVVYLTEVMPAEVRTAGFSLAYSLATVVGGMTPAICTALIQEFRRQGRAWGLDVPWQPWLASVPCC